tara:strand:+ start:97198 stop:98670 length:1473 start_codon:yes stop_codon:yes gene_type:complete
MSIVLVVGSEEQLRYGVLWCRKIAAQKAQDAHIVVAGEDRKVLLAHAEKFVARDADESDDGEPNRFKKTAIVPENGDAVLDWARTVNASLLLMIQATDSNDLQRVVFERSPIQTLWVRTKVGPPESADHLFQAVQAPVPLASLACETLLGLIPKHVLRPTAEDGDQLRDEIITEIESGRVTADDCIWFGISSVNRNDPTYKAGFALIHSSAETSIAMIRDGESITQSFYSRVEQWAETVAPRMQRDERIALANTLEEGSRPNLEFLGLMSAASMLAAFGLLQNSAAVIIGAMLIAPLMTPILGAGMALAYGNRPLFRSALLTITIGFVGAIVSSMLFGWLVMLFQKPDITQEMWARCRPSPLDFCVGLVGGIAAAYARTRAHLSSALAGAAIAAALVPPISTAGLQLAFGRWGTSDEGIAVTGPLLLVTVNVLTIMIGSSFILWLRGMRPEQYDDMRDRWGPRMMMLLMILAAAAMTQVIDTDYIFPSGD